MPGYRAYEVSDTGLVRSVDRIVGAKMTLSGKKSSRFIKGKMITPRLRPDGTPCVNLWRGATYKQVPVRRLVLVAFKGQRPRGMDAENKDGNVADNRLENLQWAVPPRRRAVTLKRLLGVV